jgi:hypothetical protein
MKASSTLGVMETLANWAGVEVRVAACHKMWKSSMELGFVRLNVELNSLWPCLGMASFGRGARATTSDLDMAMISMCVNQLLSSVYVGKRLSMWPLELFTALVSSDIFLD